MSRKYKHGDIVPTDVLADRLGVLAQYIADGIDNRKSHFYMSIPAELDRDADLVMSTTAGRLREYEDEIAKLKVLILEAAEVFKRIGMTEQEIIMLIKLREAAK